MWFLCPAREERIEGVPALIGVRPASTSSRGGNRRRGVPLAAPLSRLIGRNTACSLHAGYEILHRTGRYFALLRVRRPSKKREKRKQCALRATNKPGAKAKRIALYAECEKLGRTHTEPAP